MNRTDFANFMCNNLYKIFEGDFENPEFIKQSIILREAFEDNVRNIYELVGDIPLFQYVDYLTLYKEEGDIYFDEFENITDKEEILRICVDKCKKFYTSMRY